MPCDSIPIMSVYDQIKQALQDIIAPQLAEMRGELKAGLVELRGEVKELRGEFKTDLAELGGEIKALQSEVRHLDEKIDALSEKVDVTIELRERLAALEAKVR